jgi:hypothetical protein
MQIEAKSFPSYSKYKGFIEKKKLCWQLAWYEKLNLSDR